MQRPPCAVPLVLAALAVLGLAVLGLAIPGVAQIPNDEALAQAIAQGLVAACPPADAGDERARDLAAAKLAQFALLRDSVRDPIFWGGHTPDHSYRPEDNRTTIFNPFVWRRMYLSLFMFTREYRIERLAPITLLHLPCRFRNALDVGAYPYPFWHSQKKWDNYQRATEVTLVFESGKIIAGYRSDREDPNRPYVAHTWDGQWRWIDTAGREMPYVALYTYLFSAANPHVSRLDAAYRALEEEARQHNCFFCHSPANPAQMNPLRLLNFPNQALTVRHEIVTQLEQNTMPPGGGISDSSQRRKLIDLAREFAAVGDQALDYEGEFRPLNSP
jgi:hypothetical protein